MQRTVLFLAAALTAGLLAGCSTSGHNHGHAGHGHAHSGPSVHDSTPIVGDVPEPQPSFGQLQGDAQSGETW